MGKTRDLAPRTLFTYQYCFDGAKQGQKLFTEGKFAESKQAYLSTLQCIPLGVAKDAAEEKQYLELIDICKEYITATSLEILKKSVPETEKARQLELAAYQTTCKVMPLHKFLILRGAASAAHKAGNFVTAASIAKRIIQGPFQSVQAAQESMPKIRQLLQVCDSKGTDAHVLNWDGRASPDDFKMCSGSLTPIKPSDLTTQCPFCSALYHVSYKGKLCDICQLAEIGANTLGIQLRPI